MSIFNDLLEKLTGLDLDGSDSISQTAERPCANCPSNCAIAGTACSVCEPYKKKLIDVIYHVNHLDEYYAQYEVVSTPQAASGGTTHCKFCGANSNDPYICEYCGSQLSETPAASGKIQVSAASEIPNPITQAQDIIWERYDAVIKKYAAAGTNGIKGSLISDLVSQLIGSDEDNEEESILGAKMSEAEIKEAAGLYGVSVGDYLTGLDNGKYLTLSGKKAADAQKVSASGFSPASIGIPGMAAVGMFADSMFRDNGRRPSQRVPQRPARPSAPKEPEKPSRPAYRDEPSRITDQLQRPSGATERRRPDSSARRPSAGREVPERSSGNRRENMISRTTGERKNNPTPTRASRGGDSDRSGGRRR